MTCWRRLYEWQKAGVWPAVQQLLVTKLPMTDKIDWSRAMVGRMPEQTTKESPTSLSAPVKEEEEQDASRAA
jgi:hypothetical protein